MANWYDQDEWWENTALIMFSTQAWERAAEEVERVLTLAALEPPIRVLDLPCGFGRHTLEFARLGCTVTAVDRTKTYIRRTQNTLNEAGLKAEVIQADMRDFVRPDAFDLVVNLYTSFGYFEDQEDDLKVLMNFYQSLRPGGTLVIEMMGKEVLARKFIPRTWHEIDDDTILLEDRRITRDWTWIEVCWTLIRGGEKHQYPFTHRIYGASDLKQLLVKTGFELIRIYGSLAADSPYDHTAERLVVVAQKPLA